ncbi:MAG TPA: hypothetical protein PKW79_03330, partial [Rhabdochlamydiaceae bacterium]|nr:hypothetical protein [Rhabdochlamydiaceae bacterium]
VVAILDEVSWSRKCTDPIKFVGRISAGNRKIFEAWVMKQDTGSDISVDWVTKQYDVDAKQYYQRFHSEGKEIKFVRADSPPPTIKAHTETEPTNPPNYKFTLYLTPKSEGGEQTLGFASGADHKMSVPLGITTG